MSSPNPSHRADALIEGAAKPTTPLEKAFVSRKGAPELLSIIEYISDLHASEYQREALESFIITRMDIDEIHEILKIPKEVIEAYCWFFFDMESFRDELALEEYVRTYPNEFGREMKITATSLGSDFLKFRFDRGKSNLDFKQALANLIDTSYAIARAAKLNPIDSTITREARQWMSTSIKALEAYAKVKPTFEESNEDFKLVLQNIDAVVKQKATNPAPSPGAGLKPEDILKD